MGRSRRARPPDTKARQAALILCKKKDFSWICAEGFLASLDQRNAVATVLKSGVELMCVQILKAPRRRQWVRVEIQVCGLDLLRWPAIKAQLARIATIQRIYQTVIGAIV